MTDTITGTEQMCAKDLQLGQKVRLFADPYGWATVVQKTDEFARLHRVYVHIADFSMSGGTVLHYTGYETIDLHVDSARTVEVSCERAPTLR
jgi:hypothetical protein